MAPERGHSLFPEHDALPERSVLAAEERRQPAESPGSPEALP
jgi:hypothetical protein